MSELELVPVDYETAARFVGDWHRHHKPPPGWKFGVGVATRDGQLVGVAMVGRPVSAVIQAEGDTLEVNRTCTTGHRNANSMLYGAVTRAAFAMGYRRLITYTQEGESGASLGAAGWRVIARRPARRSGWRSIARPDADTSTSAVARTLWQAAIPEEPTATRECGNDSHHGYGTGYCGDCTKEAADAT